MPCFFIWIILLHSPLQALEKANKKNDKEFRFNKNVANWLDNQAESVDLALAGKTYSEKKGHTTATISNQVFWEEVRGFSYRLDVDLNLSLPNLENKYKLMISNYNKNRVQRSNYSRGSFRRDREDDYGATFSFIERLGDFDISFEPRLQFSGGFGTFYNLRIANRTPLFKGQTHLETRIEFFADSVRGTGQFVAVNFDHVFSDKYALSLILEQEYQDAHNILTTLNGINLHQKINSKMVLNHSLVLRSSNRKEAYKQPITKESFRLQEIVLGPSFTHKVYKNDLHYSINYQYIWNREQNFKGYSASSFILSLIF